MECPECHRNKAILQAALDRLKFLDGYTGDNDIHRGVRFAVCLIRADINRERQLIPKVQV